MTALSQHSFSPEAERRGAFSWSRQRGVESRAEVSPPEEAGCRPVESGFPETSVATLPAVPQLTLREGDKGASGERDELDCADPVQQACPEPVEWAWSKRLHPDGGRDALSVELEIQMLDLVAQELHQVAFQATSGRTDRHLEEFSRRLAVINRAATRDVHFTEFSLAQFEGLRLIAMASGRVFATSVLDAFRPYFLGLGGTLLFPPEVWSQLWTALVDRDPRAMSEVFQRCFDRRNAFLFSRLNASWLKMSL